MVRIFIYRYAEEPTLKDLPEYDSDEIKPLPLRGKMVARKGETWRVESVMVGRIVRPEHNPEAPLEYLITLVPWSR